MDAQPISPEFEVLQRAVAGRYSLERELGRGGMGVVFLARDVALERPVAIKLLPPTLAFDPGLRQRFLREARTAASLSHPHIVPIHLVEQHEDLVYFVMGYVEGESLGQRVRRRGPLRTPEVMRIVREVAWALGYAHGRGVIHRDIKPDNIMIEKGSNRAVVMDFGIARVVDAPAGTAQGELIGTVHYMSPEQAAGDPVDGRSDLWSLGVTAFLALTGTLPFEGPTLSATIANIVTGEVPALRSRAGAVPTRAAAVIDRLLARDTASRFPSAESLGESVAELTEAVPPSPPEVRYFFRLLEGLQAFVAMLVLVPVVWMVGTTSFESWSDFWEGNAEIVFLLGSMFVVTFGSQLLMLGVAGRRLLRAGFAFADVRREALQRYRAHIEESSTAIVGGDVLGRMRRWRYIGGVLVVAGLAAVVLGFPWRSRGAEGWLASAYAWGVIGTAIGVILLIGAIIVPRTIEFFQRKMLAGLASAPILAGKVGRNLFRVLGWKLPRVEQTVPADAPTTALLRVAVRDLVDGLPNELRRRFEDVPALAERLERGARRLREVVERRAATGVDTTGAIERRALAVAALENLRLDLMRLRAGSATADDLTADLEQVRAVSEAVDAELAGMEEVRQLLEP